VIRGLHSGNVHDGLHFSGLGLTYHVSGSFLGLYLTHNFGSMLRLELIYLALLSTSLPTDKSFFRILTTRLSQMHIVPHRWSIAAKTHFKRCNSPPALHTLLEKPQFPIASAVPVPWPLENSNVHGILTRVHVIFKLVDFTKVYHR